MVIDFVFHVLFKSKPNVITSLFVRFERAMARLTRWPLPCHGTGPGQKTKVYSGFPSHVVWSLLWDRERIRRWKGLSVAPEPVVPWSHLGDTAALPRAVEQPQVLPSLLFCSLGNSTTAWALTLQSLRVDGRPLGIQLLKFGLGVHYCEIWMK